MTGIGHIKSPSRRLPPPTTLNAIEAAMPGILDRIRQIQAAKALR